VRNLRALAARTNEPVGPTHLLQVRTAGVVVRKLMHEVDLCGGTSIGGPPM